LEAGQCNLPEDEILLREIFIAAMGTVAIACGQKKRFNLAIVGKVEPPY
jgi:hypothetical protein